MHENQVGCCLPKLLAYSFYGALSFGMIGTLSSSYAEVEQSTSVVYAVALGAMLPFHGKIWNICIYPEKSKTRFLTSTAVVALSCVSSAVVAAIFAATLCHDLTPKKALKLSAIDFGLATLAITITSLISVCLMRECVKMHSRQVTRAKTLII